MSNLNDILPQGKLSKAFTIIKKIGEGSFGVIYSAKLNERKLNSPLPNTFAIKIEKINKSSKSSNGTLMREARLLYKLRNSPGFPKIFYSNTFEKENILIIEELGKNLENLFEANNKKFSAVCVSNIAIQALSRLRELSKKGIVHRDLKPDNFLIGQNENIETIYLIDFGLSKNFNDDKNKHIEFSKDSGFIGTPRYASINSHLGYEQSRRDDLETLAYMMVYFLKGKLPWMNLNYQKMIGETKEINPEVRNKLIMKYKMSISSDALFKELPIVFHEYFKYTKTLEFKQEPDYDMLIEKFEKFLKDKKASYKYDWDVKLSKSLREESLVISFLTIDREISNLNFDWLDEEKNPLHLERNVNWIKLNFKSKLLNLE